METLETGASDAGADEETLQTDETEESADDGETSKDGTHEDADTVEGLKKQLADKDRHIQRLEQERRPKAKKQDKPEAPKEDQDEVMTWMTLNADKLKPVGKEYQEELAFYKSHGIPVTNEIRDRALRDARARKGLGRAKSSETQRQAETSSPEQGEHRESTSKQKIPDGVKKLVPGMTEQQYEAYRQEIEARKKKA